MNPASQGAAGRAVQTVPPYPSLRFLALYAYPHPSPRCRVLLDGQDIKRVTQESLRRVVAVVPQDTIMFNDTGRQEGNRRAGKEGRTGIGHGGSVFIDTDRRGGEDREGHESVTQGQGNTFNDMGSQEGNRSAANNDGPWEGMYRGLIGRAGNDGLSSVREPECKDTPYKDAWRS